MVINCSQCEFRLVACCDCLITVLAEEKETMDIQGATGANRALGAQELRALSVLATAGLVPPLRHRAAQLGELTGAIVAL